MFGDVDRFLDRGFFDLHRTGTLYTKDGAFRLRIVAVCSFAASDDIIFGPGNLDQASMQTLLTHISQTAVHADMDDVGLIRASSLFLPAVIKQTGAEHL